MSQSELTPELKLVRAERIITKALKEVAILLREGGLPRPHLGVTGTVRVSKRLDFRELGGSSGLLMWNEQGGQTVSNKDGTFILKVEVIDDTVEAHKELSDRT